MKKAFERLLFAGTLAVAGCNIASPEGDAGVVVSNLKWAQGYEADGFGNRTGRGCDVMVGELKLAPGEKNYKIVSPRFAADPAAVNALWTQQGEPLSAHFSTRAMEHGISCREQGVDLYIERVNGSFQR